jgi:hypothetical protein
MCGINVRRVNRTWEVSHMVLAPENDAYNKASLLASVDSSFSRVVVKYGLKLYIEKVRARVGYVFQSWFIDVK